MLKNMLIFFIVLFILVWIFKQPFLFFINLIPREFKNVKICKNEY